MQINKQAPLPISRDAKGYLAVHSMFNTIQGEGPFAGYAALFVRLVGCNLQCPGCDTEYTNSVTLFSPDELLRTVRMLAPEEGLIVITGGEPFRQNLSPAVSALLYAGFDVQIESNGVLYPGNDFPWDHERLTVVISPKTGRIHPKTSTMASAYKYVLKAGDIADDGLPVSALNHPLGNFPHVARPPIGWEGPIYIQPMDEQDEELNAANARAVASTVMNNRDRHYIMGVQMHKLTGLP